MTLFLLLFTLVYFPIAIWPRVSLIRYFDKKKRVAYTKQFAKQFALSIMMEIEIFLSYVPSERESSPISIKILYFF